MSAAITTDKINISFGVLSFGSTDHPADMLANAASVTRFLADVSGSFTESGGNIGLCDQSTKGLCLILLAVESTINEALTRI